MALAAAAKKGRQAINSAQARTHAIDDAPGRAVDDEGAFFATNRGEVNTEKMFHRPAGHNK
eukprot:4408643-Alexandrium_andersonii.AAC.2